MGIEMNNPIYRRSAPNRDTPQTIICEAFKANQNLDLLVVILPGATPFYGEL